MQIAVSDSANCSFVTVQIALSGNANRSFCSADCVSDEGLGHLGRHQVMGFSEYTPGSIMPCQQRKSQPKGIER